MSRGSRRAIALVTTLAATLSSTAALAAGGDTCTKATTIGPLPFVDAAGTTCASNNDVDNTGAAVCADLPGAYAGPDVFYKVVLGAGNDVAFSLTYPAAATGDLALFLLEASSCSTAAKCAGNSIDVKGAGQGPERIKTASYPAGTYYLVVDSSVASGAGSCGAFTLNVTGTLGAVSTNSDDAGSDASNTGGVTGAGGGGAGGAATGGAGGAATGGAGGATTGGAGGTATDSGTGSDANPGTAGGATSSASGGQTSAGGSSAGNGGALSVGGATNTGGNGGRAGSGATGAGASSAGGGLGTRTDAGVGAPGESADASTGSGSAHESSGCDCAVGGETNFVAKRSMLAELTMGALVFAARVRRRKRR